MARELPDRNELVRMRSQGWRLEDLGRHFMIPGYMVWTILTSEVTDDEIEAFFRENTP
ncbi:hypothetical protein [Crystallibacter degradans]|uniref:hypothetical protein n=1 Tax=Crystallibacter degradans TaxID=2726743 RepID=UPI001475866F|nr:hypothetical protein [Arthrobacter sp. SF27]NMR31970.1 hypothetical protein [Arthrobacter sp. SF27]